MGAQEIVEVVGDLVPDDGITLGQAHGPQALVVARQIQAALVPRMERDPAYAPLWRAFRTAPREQAPALAGVVQVLLAADAALGRRLDALLEEYRQATGSSGTTIRTGGGAYIGGDVTVRIGDFVGRDKREVHITGDGNVVGDGSSATVVTGDPE